MNTDTPALSDGGTTMNFTLKGHILPHHRPVFDQILRKVANLISACIYTEHTCDFPHTFKTWVKEFDPLTINSLVLVQWGTLVAHLSLVSLSANFLSPLHLPIKCPGQISHRDFFTFASISSAFSLASCSMKAIMCLICRQEETLMTNNTGLSYKRTWVWTESKLSSLSWWKMIFLLFSPTLLWTDSVTMVRNASVHFASQHVQLTSAALYEEVIFKVW